jgi:hypothetical protein
VSPADVAGLAGRAMLIAGAAILVLAVLSIVPRLLGVRRRAVALQAAVERAERDVLAALALLEARRAETQALLAPWRTLLRWARHPLVVATLDWYRRRRRRAHE